MQKKRMIELVDEGRLLKQQLEQHRTNLATMHNRCYENSTIVHVLDELINLYDSLLEWGEAEGKIDVIGVFTPYMFDYTETDEAYGRVD